MGFKRSLREEARRHHEAAFESLSTANKKALLRNAQLREEVSLNRTGLEALERQSAAEESELVRERGKLRLLKTEEIGRASVASATRRSREAAHLQSGRLDRALLTILGRRRAHLERVHGALTEAKVR